MINMSQDSHYHIFSHFLYWKLSHVLAQNQIRDYRLKLNLNIIGSDIIAILQVSSYGQKELKLYTCQEKFWLHSWMGAEWQWHELSVVPFALPPMVIPWTK